MIFAVVIAAAAAVLVAHIAARTVVAALATLERLEEGRDRAAWESAIEERLDAADERVAAAEEQAAEVLRRARAAGLGERLPGRR